MNNVQFSNVEITGGFWKAKQKLNRESIIWAVYDRFIETGRFEALKCNWTEKKANKPHIFWDSDVAKWMESAAYLIKEKPNARLEKILDKWIDVIAQNQEECGYFNSYFCTFKEEKRFDNRDRHELYCVGHLIEAAIAYFDATGKRKFLDIVCKMADYVEKRFLIDGDTGFKTPGHEEIELALVKLYDCTGENRYLELAKYFVNTRGTINEGKLTFWCADNNKYAQSDVPAREISTAEGHSVRATYFYSAMADIAYRTKDKELLDACDRVFDNIVTKRMYITGGIGSTAAGEAFTIDYDLPNHIAYAESCAAIGLVLFASRMLRFKADSKYSDIIEKVIYNGFLSAVSLDGKSFFYVNPLEILTEFNKRDVSTDGGSVRLPPAHRFAVFNCSCCPPNITRFISSLGGYVYGDDGETVYVHQFMQSNTTVKRGDRDVKISVNTKYPENGKISISVSGGDTKVAIRIPAWCDSYEGKTVNGYAYFNVKNGETLDFDFKMKVCFVAARPEVDMDCGRYAVMRGPVVYCTEAIDNGMHLRDIRISKRSRIRVGKNRNLGVSTLTLKGYRTEIQPETSLYYNAAKEKFKEVEVKMIPYYAFANRDQTDMLIWHLLK